MLNRALMREGGTGMDGPFYGGHIVGVVFPLYLSRCGSSQWNKRAALYRLPSPQARYDDDRQAGYNI